jgi:glycosyltransferase involved in cell wall biosynthesis
METDSFEQGFFLQTPMVKAARTFQFSRSPEVEVVLQPPEFRRPVQVLQPVLVLPGGYPPAATRRAAMDLGQKLVKEFFRDRPYVLWINSITHFQAQLAECLMPGAQLRIFDSTDLWMMYQRSGGEHIKQANAILNGSDVVLCSSERALEHISHPRKLLLSDCTRETGIHRDAAPLDLPPLFPKPPGAVYIGFTGMITSEKTDFDLLHAIFLRFPDYQFIFVGSTNRSSLLAGLKNYPNFHHIPEVPKEVLGAIVGQFDVAIVPELDNRYTRGSDGDRIFDYLANGVQVLSATSQNGETFGGAVQVAHSVWEFSYLLERLATDARPRHAETIPRPVPGQWDFAVEPLKQLFQGMLSGAVK